MKFKKGDKVRVITIDELRRDSNISAILYDRMDLLHTAYATVIDPNHPIKIRFDRGLSGLIVERFLELVSDMDAENDASLDRTALNEAFAAILS